MSFIKIFKFAQKGSKKIKRAKGAAGPPPKWPEGTRVGVFGHENSGKTVFFTALYTQSKTAGNFHISVRDNATANEFFRHDMAIKGVDVDSSGSGTIAAKSVPKRFPDPTVKDVVLQFTAILDGSKKIPVVTYDYNGKAASISDRSDEAEKIRDFMAGANGILFFFDPKVLAADPEVQARASSFINILEYIVPLKSRLPIPVGLVITKADILPGFTGEDKTILVRAEDEQVMAEDYEGFLEKVLEFDGLAGNREWASTVRNILVKLREFIRIVVGRTLDFQIFFVSSTGNKPEKIGVDVGRSIYAPPEKVNPCGVTEPFHWILKSIVRSQRLNVLRRVSGFVAVASIIWIFLYSLPFMIHFGGLLRSTYRVEDSVLESVEGNIDVISDAQKVDIVKAYKGYGKNFIVKKMFTEFHLTAGRMEDVYGGINLVPAVARLDSLIENMTRVISTPKQHPRYDQALETLILTDSHKSLVASLNKMHVGDKNDVVYLRSDRALRYWDLFTRYITNPADSATLEKINQDVNFNSKNAPNYDEYEVELGNALLGVLNIKAPHAAPSLRSVRANLDEYGQLKEQINNSTDPAFVLKEAAKKLEGIRANLSGGAGSDQAAAIGEFLAEVKQWEKERTYTCVLQNIPDMGHLHIEVTESGDGPSWSNETQLLEGDEIRIKWKPGDDVHLAFDELKHKCNWGNQPSDRVVFTDEYALFEMEGKVVFSNIGKTVTIGFKGGLKEKLPKLK